MKSVFVLFPIVLAPYPFCRSSAAELKTIDDFREAAAKANAILTIPDWEQTPEAVEASTKDAIAKANAALDEIGAQDLKKVTFKSTVVALDDLIIKPDIAANKATIIKETNTNEAMRTAGENAVKVFQDWAVGIDYREDVYKAIKAFADTKPKLAGEDEKLLEETMRDYRRAGLELAAGQTQRSRTSAQTTGQTRDRFRHQHRRTRKRRSFSPKPSWMACRTVSSPRPESRPATTPTP